MSYTLIDLYNIRHALKNEIEKKKKDPATSKDLIVSYNLTLEKTKDILSKEGYWRSKANN